MVPRHGIAQDRLMSQTAPLVADEGYVPVGGAFDSLSALLGGDISPHSSRGDQGFGVVR